jgi:hypothetical protein
MANIFNLKNNKFIEGKFELDKDVLVIESNSKSLRTLIKAIVKISSSETKSKFQLISSEDNKDVYKLNKTTFNLLFEGLLKRDYLMEI